MFRFFVAYLLISYIYIYRWISHWDELQEFFQPHPEKQNKSITDVLLGNYSCVYTAGYGGEKIK